MTPNFDHGVQINRALHLFFIFFVIIFVLRIRILISSRNWITFLILLILLKIKFGYVQIDVPKIGVPMSKTT